MKIVRTALLVPVAIVMVCAIVTVYLVVVTACGIAEILDSLLEW